MPRALLSVTDKTGLVEFAQRLHEAGCELISTGGTAAALRQANLPVRDVAEITGFPEMLDGRVKTLHPLIHGGILGDRRRESHRQQMETAGIPAFDLVVVNLYRFEDTVSGPHTADEAIESIDIGGPAMIRAAAKNHASVAVVVDPTDYERIAHEFAAGALSDETRRALAAKAFRHTAYYDSLIARYLTAAVGETPYTETLTVGLRRSSEFRYGENYHQRGALYTDALAPRGLAQAELLWGVPMGYNNWNDADGAWELVADLPGRAVAITKHGNPCGAAVADTYADAWRQAKEADPISAFGGVVAVNGPIDLALAEAMTERGNKLDVIVAPDITDEALALFQNRKGWGQDVRILRAPLPTAVSFPTVRSIRGGVLVQDSDEDPGTEWRVVTTAVPTPDQMETLRFLWRIIPHVKSNAIIVGTGNALLGVGAGQMNRVQSVRLAIAQAGDRVHECGLASDAFFPFPDSIDTLADAGIEFVVQPGGSKNDPAVIAQANERGVAMVFTSVRHFRH